MDSLSLATNQYFAGDEMFISLMILSGHTTSVLLDFLTCITPNVLMITPGYFHNRPVVKGHPKVAKCLNGSKCSKLKKH